MRRPSTLDRSKDLPQAAAGVTNRAPAPCMPSHSPRPIFSAPHDSIAAACSPPLPPYSPYQAILGRRGLVAYLHRDVEWVGIFPLMAQPTVEFTSDASGNWGCGAWSGTTWFQFQWPQVQPTDILHFWSWWLCYLLVQYGPGAGMDKVSCAGVITKLSTSDFIPILP